MDKALQTMINNMPEKTGKTLEEWLQILKVENIEKHGMAVKFLKAEHGVTHGFANTIVSLSKNDASIQGSPDNSASGENLITAQYNGKESLIPIYECLLSAITSLGADVIITPKKTSVSFIRKKQFALIKPATKTRIDLGLKLKDIDIQGKLEGSGPFGTMCTHRIQLKSIEDVDADVVHWLSTAYEKSI
jgi:predicted transport protein